MIGIRVIALAGVSLLSVATPVMAQDAPSADAGVDSVADNNDIVVTARRRDESLQDVPQTVNAVTSEQIGKLNLLDFKDIQKVVPGLQLVGGNSGFDSAFTLRGVSYSTLSQAGGPTVQFYVNEVPVDSNQMFQSMFDIQQIEVLRGPQGTLRGRSAPAGAITVTTKQANLNEIGGTLDMTGTNFGNINIKAAVGVPIIQDVLAVRISGLIDNNDLNGVNSVNNGTDPYKRTQAIRATVRFEPTDWVSANVTYQHLWTDVAAFTQVFGPGSPGGGATPANFNGPAIGAGDRLSVQPYPSLTHQEYDLVTGNLSFRFAGQRLSYVGSYGKTQLASRASQNPYNMFQTGGVPLDSNQKINTDQSGQSHELRLSSDDRLFGMIDYTVGAFYQKAHASTNGIVDATPQTGVNTTVNSLVDTSELGFFGNATLHIGDRTELSGGVRHITAKQAYLGPYTVAGQGTSNCVPAFSFCLPDSADETPNRDTHVVWNASLSHKFSDDFLVYGNIGTSYRPGFFVVVPFSLSGTNPGGANPGTPFQSALDLRFHDDAETSRGWELGFKASFLDKRARLNVAVYRQTYKNYSFQVEPTYYYSVPSNPFVPASIGQNAFTATADAVVKGIDIEASFQVTPRFNIGGGFSWAKGRVNNDLVPCNDGNFDGVADAITPTLAGFRNANVIVARCLSNQSITSTPTWSLSLQSEYSHSLSDKADGFLRGNFNYYPDNANVNRSSGIIVSDYSVLDLYTGIRSPKGDWEVALFAKNLLNTRQVLSQSLDPAAVTIGGTAVPVGYRSVSYTARREFGLNVRYSFGSR